MQGAPAQSSSYPRGSTPPLPRGSSGNYGKRTSSSLSRQQLRRSEDLGSSPVSDASYTYLRMWPRSFKAGGDSRPRSCSEEGGTGCDSSAPARPAVLDSQPAHRSEGFSIREEPEQSPGRRVLGEDYPQQGLLSQALSSSLSRQLSGGVAPDLDAANKAQLERCLSGGGRLAALDATDEEFKQLQERFSEFGLPSVVQAYQLARQTLTSQPERQPRDFMAHNLGTAAVLAELGAGAPCICTAVLHRVLDKGSPGSSLQQSLGPDVASHISNASRIADLSQIVAQNQGQTNKETRHQFSRMLLGMADMPAVLVHLADRLQLMREGKCSREQAQEVLDVWGPLASQLGVWFIKAQLEDHAFQILHPKDHARLEAAMQASDMHSSIGRELDLLKSQLARQGMTNVDLVGRPKNLYAVWKKMQTKGKSLKDMYDLRALRIVVRGGKAACYDILQKVHGLWTPVEGRFKNYIRNPKANGYRSLHTVITASDGQPMEIQIRSDKMHFINELGVAAHWRYKEDSSMNDKIRNCQVAFARSIIAWNLELHDKKCRPTGAGVHDKALAHICPFPTHTPDCAANDTDAFLRFHAPRTDQKDGGPVYVITLDSTAGTGPGRMAIKELPAACTLGQLDSLLALERAASQRSRPSKLLVNGQEAAEEQLLQHGDKVEVVRSQSLQEPPTRASFTHTLADKAHKGGGYSPQSLAQQTAMLRFSA